MMAPPLGVLKNTRLSPSCQENSVLEQDVKVMIPSSPGVLKSTGLSPVCNQTSSGSKRAGLSPICTHDSAGCKRTGLSPICTENSMLEQLSQETVKCVHNLFGRQEMNMMTLLQEATAEEQESKRVALLYESECEEIVMEPPPVSTATSKLKSVRFGSATIIPTAEESSSLIPAMPEKVFFI